MARPQKKRFVCMEPSHFLFGPLGLGDPDKAIIHLTVDELECLRLLDIEHLTQEQVALQMNVARTTVQRIYEEARNKVTRMLIDGNYLQISGGEYQLCTPEDRSLCRNQQEDPSKQIKERK